MGSDLPRSRADTRLRAIRCGGQRTTRHGQAAGNSRSRRPVTDRLSSTAHVRSVPNRVVAHRTASACPLLLADTVFWPSLRPPPSMATSVWVRLCASMSTTVIDAVPRRPVGPVVHRPGMHAVSQSKDGSKGESQAPCEYHRGPQTHAPSGRYPSRRKAALRHSAIPAGGTNPESQAAVIGMTAR